MKWPFRKRAPEPLMICLDETPESKRLEEAKRDWPKIHARASELQRLRQQNHFRERMRHAFEEHR